MDQCHEYNKKYDDDTFICKTCEKVVCLFCSHPCEGWNMGCGKLWCLSHDENRCQSCGSVCPFCEECSIAFLEKEGSFCKDCAKGTTPASKIEEWKAYRATGNRHPSTKKANNTDI